MTTTRRAFLTGLGGALIAAPAIVRASSLMPVRGIVMAVEEWTDDIYLARQVGPFPFILHPDQFADLVVSGAYRIDDDHLIVARMMPEEGFFAGDLIVRDPTAKL